MSDSSSSRASGSSPAGRSAGASPVDPSVTSDGGGSQATSSTSSSAGVAPTSGVSGSTSSRDYPDELRDRESRERIESDRHEKFGGFNLGADFFGWLVAIALTVLLASITGAVAAGLGSHFHVTQDDAERQAGTFALSTAIALLVILMIAYYAGGYVAGRMSRYDGARQGVGVWLIGLLVTIVVLVVGAIFGDQYDIFQRVDLPSMPIPTDTATWGGIIALAAVLVGTLVAAILGGLVGRRYHSKVDRFRG